MPSLPLPLAQNEPFWDLVEAIALAANIQTHHHGGSLTTVNLSSPELRGLLSAAVEGNNAPRNNLIDAITRVVNEDGGGTWANVDLSGVREFIIPVVSEDGFRLRYASAELKNDREVVLAACNQYGDALMYASNMLKNDREVVLAACNTNGLALRYASAALKNDREVVMAAIIQNAMALLHAPDATKDDREVVLAAINQNGYALQYASAALKNDREVVLAAINQNGCALQYASAALKNDRGMVMAAIIQSGRTLKFASATLQDDREVVMAACSKYGNALEHASVGLQADHEVVMVAVAQNYKWTLRFPGHTERFAIRHACATLRAEFEADRIVTHVATQLQLRASFFGPFLCAIALPAPDVAAAKAPWGARCLLPRLDIGEEKPIQQLIARFTGVPVGSSWRFVQLAAARLGELV